MKNVFVSGPKKKIGKIQQQVIDNAKLLDEKWSEIIKDSANHGKYIIFHKGQIKIVDDFEIATTTGRKVFGESTGFVVRKITNQLITGRYA